MTAVVVEVGPVTVRGPNHGELEWVSAGVDGIDDELVLIGDRAVAVTDVWRRIMHDVVGGFTETLVVVCPTWWSSSRLEQVHDAARTVAGDVVMLRRADLCPQTSLVELAPEFVVVCSPRGIVDVVPLGDSDALLARIPMSMPALVDVPEGLGDCGPVVEGLRANGIDATGAESDWVWRGVDARQSPDEAVAHQIRPSRRRGGQAAVLAGTLLSAAALCGVFVARHNVAPTAEGMPMSLLVEGRVGVMVPAQWVVQRVTSGPGSARVQVVSPDDRTIALHVTQSSLATQPSHEQMAHSLQGALDQEPDGVFVDFNPTDSRAGRTVVTYREIRADREIAWFVMIDGSLRIAVGCQSAPGREEAVRQACDRAIRSAHAVF
jgi:type VII secretion-associated protein (TIGR03931 family)